MSGLVLLEKGLIFDSKRCGKFIILKYIKDDNIKIKFLETGYICKRIYFNLVNMDLTRWKSL